MSGEQKVVMVTGSTGLVGSAVQIIAKKEQLPDEKWVFLSSKDGNLRYASHSVRQSVSQYLDVMYGNQSVSHLFTLLFIHAIT